MLNTNKEQVQNDNPFEAVKNEQDGCIKVFN